MVNQDKTLDQIYDLFAVRILVESVKDCYAALGVIHEMYKPSWTFQRLYCHAKANMYQSLHTTLIGPKGQPFEIQIRTYEMHRTAEYGIAAHWNTRRAAEAMSRTLKVRTARRQSLPGFVRSWSGSVTCPITGNS